MHVCFGLFGCGGTQQLDTLNTQLPCEANAHARRGASRLINAIHESYADMQLFVACECAGVCNFYAEQRVGKTCRFAQMFAT